MRSSRFGDLRSLLQRPPSDQNFAELVTLFPDGELSHDEFAYASDLLGRWPGHIPRTVLDAWIDWESRRFARACLLCSRLSFTRGKIPMTGIHAIAVSENLAAITRFGFNHQPINVRDIETLFSSEHLTSLEQVHFDGNFFSDHCMQAMVGSENTSSIQTLNIVFNELTNAGIRALVQSEHMGSLRELDLRFNKIAYHGARELLEATNLPELCFVNLMGADIHPKDRQPPESLALDRSIDLIL